MAPDELGLNSGEALQEALGDEADLDVAMIGGEFAPDGASVVIAFIVEELITQPGSQRRRNGTRAEPVGPGQA